MSTITAHDRAATAEATTAEPDDGDAPRVVALLGPSHSSERVLPVALEVSWRTGRRLVLLTVNPGSLAAHEQERHDRLIAAHPGTHITSLLMAGTGSDTAAILRSLRPTDIVCLAADRVHALAELMEGSVFMNLLRLFPGVLVAVGPHAELPRHASVMLVCVDGQSSQHPRLISGFASAAGLTTELVTAIAPHDHALAAQLVDTYDGAQLHNLASQWRDAATEPIEWDVLHGKAGDAITAAAADPKVACIGLVTMAFEPLARLASPSLANELIRRARRPLVLVTPAPRRITGTTTPVPVAGGAR